VFDITYTIGGLSYDPESDLESQAVKLAETLLRRRLESDRAAEAEAIKREQPEAADEEALLL